VDILVPELEFAGRHSAGELDECVRSKLSKIQTLSEHMARHRERSATNSANNLAAPAILINRCSRDMEPV
jgi:hypothetical protein